MKALTLEEFAQELRRKGDWREVEFADEILMLVDIEADVAEPYSDLCADIEHAAKDFSNPDDAPKALEWICDRSAMLNEIEEAIQASDALPKTGPNGLPIERDTDDAVKELLGEFETLREILDFAGFEHLDFKEGLEALADRADKAPPKMEYDL